VQRRIFGHKGEEVAGSWRTLHNVQLRNFNASQNITRVITSKRMGGAEHVARMGNMRTTCKILVGHHSEDLGTGEKIILK
jgi:hypothetical protein